MHLLTKRDFLWGCLLEYVMGMKEYLQKTFRVYLKSQRTVVRDLGNHQNPTDQVGAEYCLTKSHDFAAS